VDTNTTRWQSHFSVASIAFFDSPVDATESGSDEDAKDGGGFSLPARVQPIVARGSATCGPRTHQRARIGSGVVVRERWGWA